MLHRRCRLTADARRTPGLPPAVHNITRGRRRRAGTVVHVVAVCLGVGSLAPGRLAAQAPAGPFAGVTVSDSQRVALRALGARTNAATGPLAGRLQRATPADSVAAKFARDTLRAIFAAHNAAVRQVLTAEQRATFDANVRAFAAQELADARARDKQHQQRGGPGMPSASAAPAGGRP